MLRIKGMVKGGHLSFGFPFFCALNKQGTMKENLNRAANLFKNSIKIGLDP
jgi:hypothetical protein